MTGNGWTAALIDWLMDRLIDAVLALSRGSFKWVCGDPYDAGVDG